MKKYEKKYVKTSVSLSVEEESILKREAWKRHMTVSRFARELFGKEFGIPPERWHIEPKAKRETKRGKREK